MASILQHHDIDMSTGIMGVIPQSTVGGTSTQAWGLNALQTINIARHTPRDPQQAIGYRGVVDYTSGQVTTDLTLDCILTEQTAEAVAGSSVYTFADDQLIIGSENYVLTSCNVGFTAGAPATVSFGYITAGLGSELIALGSAPSVLKDGEESVFAVVMGDDGSGIELTGGVGIVLPSGVQSLTFNSTINREAVLDIRSASPINFITTYPVDITVDIETYDRYNIGTSNAAALTALGVKLAAGTDHADRSGYTSPSVDPGTDFAALAKQLVSATGMIKVDETEAMNVGGYLTYTYNYTAADLWIPLGHPVL